jgi:hypothetical protein
LEVRAPQPALSPEPLAAGLVLGEYAATARIFGWGMKELIPVARTSIDSCFAAEAAGSIWCERRTASAMPTPSCRAEQ